MPSLPKLKKTKKEKEPKELSNPEKILHDSITEADVSDDFFFTTRRVRFSASVRQCTVICLEDYSEAERKLTWYDKDDKAEINKKHDKMVRRYEAGKRCKRGMTYRGLDAWTDKGHDKFEATVSKLLSAVMDEQDAQWTENYDDPERLAMASESVSKENVEQALQYAVEDELEAQEAYKSGLKDEAGIDEIEDSTRTMSTLMVRKKQSRRRRSSALHKKEKEGRSAADKDEKNKRRKSKRKSASKKKSAQ
ncbi:unnamed protein product [Cylindrotheca closterium]|uniref:Uncharacterized protein n=1 Tax=Cylindrotheca closterium TaxID=2856 RepID=A0AAD2CG00_9STRA|nr:unnamed protein product [Cylindrotheca closterium]